MELVTFFIPVIMACSSNQVSSCEMVQYEGYFESEQQCQKKLRDTLWPTLKPGQQFNTMCVTLEVNRVKKSDLNKNL